MGVGDRDSLAQLVEKPLSDQEVISLVHLSNFHRARGVVVSHPLGMREALGSIPSVSRLMQQWGIHRSLSAFSADALKPPV